MDKRRVVGTATEREKADLDLIIGPPNARLLNPRSNDILLVEARDANGLPTGLNEIARENPKNYTAADKIKFPDGKLILKEFKTWKEYMTEISAGCANEVNQFIETQGEAIAKGRLGDIGVTAGTPGAPPPGPTVETRDGNIAQGKKVHQSSTNTWSERIQHQADAENAVDTSTKSDYNFGLAATQWGQNQWWKVDLGKDEGSPSNEPEWVIDEIRSIEIYGVGGIRYGLFSPHVGNFTVAITKTDPAGFEISNLQANYNAGAQTVLYLKTHAKDNPEPGSTLVTTITKDQTINISLSDITKGKGARYIYIRRPSYAPNDYLALAEVKVDGKATRTTAAPGGPAAEAVLKIIPRPARGALPSNPRSDYTISQTVLFEANKKTNVPVKMEIELLRKNAPPNHGLGFQSAVWSTDFTSFQITVKEPDPTSSTGIKTTATPDFITTAGCLIGDERCMNMTALKGIDSENKPEIASVPIVFAKSLSFPAPNSTIQLTLTGKLRLSIPPFTEYEMKVRAIKPETTVAGTTEPKVEAESIINFTIAP